MLLKPQAHRESNGPLWPRVNLKMVKEACGSFGRGEKINQDKKVKHSERYKEERGGEVGAIPQTLHPKFARRVTDLDLKTLQLLKGGGKTPGLLLKGDSFESVVWRQTSKA